MRGKQGRAAPTERIVNEFAWTTAIRDHAGDQCDRFRRRMQIADAWPVDLKHGMLSPIVRKIVRTAFNPSIEDGLVFVMVIGSPHNERLLDPDELMLIAETAVFHALNEKLQVDGWDRRVDRRPGLGMNGRRLQRAGE